MPDDSPEPSTYAESFEQLRPKDKQPASKSILDKWVAQAGQSLGLDASGRLGWLVASSVAIAAVQRALDADGRQLFLLKGGTLLQHRLRDSSRVTKDVDGLVRGDLDVFFAVLDDALAEPWGPLTLRRGEVEVINAPGKLIKPRRFDIILDLRGITWRRVTFEVSADEAGIGDLPEPFVAPTLRGFGLPDPDVLVGIAMRSQIAQKLHAVTDPHDPPTLVNNRARDIPDLLLIRNLAAETGSPTLDEIRQSCEAVFAARAQEAEATGGSGRTWPPTLIAHDHWYADYPGYAAEVGVTLPLGEAVKAVNIWIGDIVAN